jgi:hypothetical protein
MQGYSAVHSAAGGAEQTALDGAELLQSAPSVVLAEAASGARSGRVLSVAPLLGAAASVDPGHARWLHVHVRPPARGLLKTVRVRACNPHISVLPLSSKVPCSSYLYPQIDQFPGLWHQRLLRGSVLRRFVPASCNLRVACAAQGASIGGVGQQLKRQLVDGHWVLAFRDGASAHAACAQVAEHAAALRAHYAAALAPLLKGIGGAEPPAAAPEEQPAPAPSETA